MLGRDCMYDVIVRLFRARGFYGLHAGHKRTPALGHTTARSAQGAIYLSHDRHPPEHSTAALSLSHKATIHLIMSARKSPSTRVLGL